MAAKKSGLGRGLNALIQESPVPSTAEEPEVTEGVRGIPVEDISANPWQPRHQIHPEELAELVLSVRDHGVLQPVIVRKKEEGKYELIAGERRLTAAREAGLGEIPAVVKALTDQQALEIALIENLQRENLNILEEAEGYRTLAEQFNLTQEQVAQRVGKARATVANALRILNLTHDVKQLIGEGKLSNGHAKALMGVEIEEEQILLAERAVKEGLSVRELEKLVAQRNRPKRKPRAERSDLPGDYLRDLTDRLHRHFGTSVTVHPSKTLSNGKKAKGRLEIDFYSNDELHRILETVGLDDSM